ncbi:MAG: T9SS type A sorting domain-containing protein [Candidatus Coatesbacteria bacterium]|nr:MAG: T9SS type A sorting domain-containing protein [Candidatus Coatesbacteria bacterium]
MKKVLFVFLVAAASAFAYRVEIDPAQLEIRPAAEPAFVGYDVVRLAGEGVLPAAPGQPALPAVVAALALPPGTEIEAVDVSTAEPIVLPGTYRVMPVQEPTPWGENAGATPPNAAAYASAEPFPGKLAYSFESGNMGGYGVGSVLLAPVQYVPATGKLLFYPIMDFDLRLRHASGEVTYPRFRLAWIDRDLRGSLAATVINPWEIRRPSGVRLLEAGAYDENVFPYLIITNEALETEAQKLATWKTKKGLQAKVVTTSFIDTNYSGADTEEKIRNCIKDYYSQYGTQYVCLIGTSTVVPVRKVYDPSYIVAEGDSLVPTDNYYGCLDGTFNADGDGYWGEYGEDDVDWVYDVFVGRIHVSTPSDLGEVIDKTLCYEGAAASSEGNPYNYQHQVILAGGWADSSTNLKLMMEYIRDNYLTSSHWSFTELWDDTYPGGSGFNSTNFTAEMEKGTGLVAHMAHCNTHVLGTNSGSVSNTTLRALANHPKFMAVLYSVGCYASNTDYDDNCAAYFVAAPEGGGVGFCCNTRYGWYSRGDPLNYYSQEFIKEYFKQFGVADVYETGKLNAFHKHTLQSYLDQWIYRYIYFELIHTGDPDIWIPSANVATLTVDCESTIPTGEQSYDVHVADSTDGNVENALVCVWKGSEVYASGKTDASGNVSFDINPETTGTMFLTVSAHNAKTFEVDIAVSMTSVTLTSFAGRRTPAGIALNWTVTATEPIAHFDLYRRPVATAAAPAAGSSGSAGAGPAAAKAREDGWTKVNAEPIRGRSPYRYVDTGVPAGVYEYRLEVELARGSEALGTARVGGQVPTRFAFEVAPNPARTAAKLTLGLPSSAAVKVVLYDLAGRKVTTVTEGPRAEGEHVVELDVSGLPAGVYVLRLETEGHAAARRLAVVR